MELRRNQRSRMLSHQQGVYAIVLASFFSLVLIFWFYDPGEYVGNVQATAVFTDTPDSNNITSTSFRTRVGVTTPPVGGLAADTANLATKEEHPPTSDSEVTTAITNNKKKSQESPHVATPTTKSKRKITPATLQIPLPKNSPLEACTERQLGVSRQSLGSTKMIKWMTNCPDASWLDDRKPSLHEMKHPETWPIFHEPNGNGRKPISIFVGCNKAMDAVSTLRMLSRNGTYDKQVWRETMDITDSACNQHTTPQIPISVGEPSRDATVYCIEAMPSTYERLDESVRKLKWDSSKSLRIHKGAISETDGTALFPNDRVGTEELGISHCNLKRFQGKCDEVPQYKLDTFLQQHALKEDANATIDFLSVDVEGFDWLVLKGATDALDRTNYLEFEYNSVGPWLHHNLSTAVGFLSESKGFVCYWAGYGGNLWRMTGCWVDAWDIWKQWSNVACVHTGRSPNLAARMEERFIHTLWKKGYREAPVAGQSSTH